MRSFELTELGGPAGTRLRRHTAGFDDLPWGTLDVARYPRPLVERARLSWTQGAFSEYATGAAFANLAASLLAIGAPIDLAAMASDFVAEEMAHAMLNARMAAELGGAVVSRFDEARLAPCLVADDPRLRAVELAVKLGCVDEGMSAPLLAANARAATHPLTAAVLTRIAREEPPHARLGWLVLEWSDSWLSDDDRRHLGEVASRALSSLAAELPAATVSSPPAGIGDLGWLPLPDYLALAERAEQHIIERFALYGLAVRASMTTKSSCLR
ncbi:MAG: ferritin-like domain-containing protein [Myxococcales bacterium]|nr:ferritin-like domain-containing protein [Myxococcales bacterium]